MGGLFWEPGPAAESQQSLSQSGLIHRSGPSAEPLPADSQPAVHISAQIGRAHD